MSTRRVEIRPPFLLDVRRVCAVTVLMILVASCAVTPDTATSTTPPTASLPSTTSSSPPAPVQPMAGFIAVTDALVIGVRASAESVSSVNVLDGNVSTSWATSETAPQWIEFQLREPLFIKSIKVTIGLDATGVGDHEFRAGAHDNPGRMAAAIELEAGLGSGFEIFVEYEAEFVRITTTRSTGTVSWAEIEIVVEE